MPTLTQERLKELLHYNLDTGIFTWKARRSQRAEKGSVAGSKHTKGYVIIGIDRKLYRAHRLAFLYVNGAMPDDQVDHINHVRDYNAWANLRESTGKENSCNQSMRCTNTSGVMGVSWYKLRSKWLAIIQAEGKSLNLGYFNKKEDAIAARQAAAIRYGYHENHGCVR